MKRSSRLWGLPGKRIRDGAGNRHSALANIFSNGRLCFAHRKPFWQEEAAAFSPCSGSGGLLPFREKAKASVRFSPGHGKIAGAMRYMPVACYGIAARCGKEKAQHPQMLDFFAAFSKRIYHRRSLSPCGLEIPRAQCARAAVFSCFIPRGRQASASPERP